MQLEQNIESSNLCMEILVKGMTLKKWKPYRH